MVSRLHVNVALPAFAAVLLSAGQRSIFPAHRPFSSRPMPAACGRRMMEQTDRQTDGRPTVT